MLQIVRPRLIFTAILICVCIVRVIESSCPPGWKSWRDSCYILLEEGLSWNEAARVCGRPRSSLAVPNSMAENDFIYGMQRDACTVANTCGLWIGCKHQRGNVACLGQTQESPFTHWTKRQPTNYQGCIFMSKQAKGKWQDKFLCALYELKVVCEMPRQVHVYSLTMSTEGRIQPQCLRGQDIKSVAVNGVIECGAACWAEPRCRSFNLWQGGPRKICQLNNATVPESDEGDVIFDDECNSFEL